MLNTLDDIKRKADIFVENGTLYVKVREFLSGEESLYLENTAKSNNLNLEVSKASMTKEDVETMERMDKFLDKMNAVPESRKNQMSQRLLDRMQSEIEAGYDAKPPTEEQRREANEILYGKYE